MCRGKKRNLGNPRWYWSKTRNLGHLRWYCGCVVAKGRSPHLRGGSRKTRHLVAVPSNTRNLGHPRWCGGCALAKYSISATAVVLARCGISAARRPQPSHCGGGTLWFLAGQRSGLCYRATTTNGPSHCGSPTLRWRYLTTAAQIEQIESFAGDTATAPPQVAHILRFARISATCGGTRKTRNLGHPGSVAVPPQNMQI